MSKVPVPVVNTSRGNHGGATQVHTCVPLNSKRLTAHSLKRIARALDVLSSSSLDEIRTLVDGKLAELGNEPCNTQVWLHGSGVIELVNADGVFLQIDKEADFPPLPQSPEDSDTDPLENSNEVQLLKQALLDAESSRDTLQEEVIKLTAEVEKLSQCCKELWSLNCTQ